MTAAAGVAAAAGLAVLGLGALTARDLFQAGLSRPTSRFGLAFLLVTVTLGPHLLAIAAVAGMDGTAPAPLLEITVVATLIPAAAFLALRIERLGGGRGDRTVAGTPAWLRAGAWATALGTGAVLGQAVVAASQDGLTWLAAPSLVLAAAYACVAVLVLTVQQRRRAVAGGWSASGIALAGLFLAAGLAEAAGAATSGTGDAALAIDLAGAPAALYLIWSAWRLNLAARAETAAPGRPRRGDAPTRRSSPWVRPARS